MDNLHQLLRDIDKQEIAYAERRRNNFMVLIDKMVGDEDVRVAVMSSRDTALKVLCSDIATERLGALFALTYYWRDRSVEFQQAVLDLIKSESDPKMKEWGIIAVGNAFKGSNDEVALETLSQCPLTEAVRGARRPVKGEELPIDLPGVERVKNLLSRGRKYMDDVRTRFPEIFDDLE